MATIFDFLYMGCTWRHLKNTTEPSMCGGDAALCQITLTTCYYYGVLLEVLSKFINKRATTNSSDSWSSFHRRLQRRPHLSAQTALSLLATRQSQLADFVHGFYTARCRPSTTDSALHAVPANAATVNDTKSNCVAPPGEYVGNLRLLAPARRSCRYQQWHTSYGPLR